MRDTCSFVWLGSKLAVFCFSPCQPGPAGTSFTAHLYVWVKLGEGLWGKRGRERGLGDGGLILDGILVTWGELLSSFHPPYPHSPLDPFFSLLPSRAPLPGAQAECSVRRVSTERPLCVLTKAECPGDKRGRSRLRPHKARGRRGVGGGGGGGPVRGAICWGLNGPSQPQKL